MMCDIVVAGLLDSPRTAQRKDGGFKTSTTESNDSVARAGAVKGWGTLRKPRDVERPATAQQGAFHAPCWKCV